MLTISGTAMWLPLYALILWLVWRRSGWRGMLIFLVPVSYTHLDVYKRQL